MTGPAGLTLSLLMLAGIILTGGGIWMLTKKRGGPQPWLMIVAGLVMFGNVAIWMVPVR